MHQHIHTFAHSGGPSKSDDEEDVNATATQNEKVREWRKKWRTQFTKFYSVVGSILFSFLAVVCTCGLYVCMYV
jgi:hypothetical protein